MSENCKDGLDAKLIKMPNADASQTRMLGRLFSFDPRDARHPLEVSKPSRKRSRFWHSDVVLDQGPSMCVAASWLGLLAAGPVRQRQPLPEMEDIYRRAQAVDEWSDEVPYDGTSVRAGAKVLKALGYLHTYKWAHTAKTSAAFLIAQGPLVFGTDWLEGMNCTDADGFIHAEGEVFGGHAYLVIGVNLDRECPDGTKGAFRIQNAWGEEWGERGRAWLSLTDADKLIRNYGEVCSSAEINVL